MALTADQITAQNFKDFYDTILPYLNGGHSAENVTYGQGSVKDALDEIYGNKYNNYEDISSHTTFATAYICPTDGYLQVVCSSSGTAGAGVKILSEDATSDANYIAIINVHEGSYNASSLYVKKGMKILVYYKAGSPTLRFYKLK